MKRPAASAPLLGVVALAAALAACLVRPAIGTAQDPDVARCAPAEAFLVEASGMVALTTPDTIRDWRTRRTLPGCRVTAAGVTDVGLAEEARAFYERLRDAGWTRTPDPRDAPAEASLRFRSGETDCLFNVWAGGMTVSAEEIEVNSRVVPGPGESRFGVIVQCLPALDAAPREPPAP